MMNDLTPTLYENPLILLVDDLPTNLHVLVSALKTNFRLKTATSGASALVQLKDKTNLPKLVILDVKMPGMSGIEVLRRIRDYPDTSDIPVILVSADISEQNELAGLNLGADEYLINLKKSVELGVIIGSVRISGAKPWYYPLKSFTQRVMQKSALKNAKSAH